MVLYKLLTILLYNDSGFVNSVACLLSVLKNTLPCLLYGFRRMRDRKDGIPTLFKSAFPNAFVNHKGIIQLYAYVIAAFFRRRRHRVIPGNGIDYRRAVKKPFFPRPLF